MAEQDELSDLERRLVDEAGHSDDLGEKVADLLIEAADVIGESRRELEIFDGSNCPCCSCESARTALAKLKGAKI